jgi:hypothetical protein
MKSFKSSAGTIKIRASEYCPTCHYSATRTPYYETLLLQAFKLYCLSTHCIRHTVSIVWDMV